MKHMLWLFVATLATTVALGLVGPSAEVQAKEAQFVGVKTCGKCHKKTTAGEQLPIWEKTDHATAFTTLGTAEAKKRALTVGVKTDPQKSPECLVCHTTGFGEPKKRFDKKFDVTQGVQCEVCHGAGSLYRKKKVMKKIAEELGEDNKGKSPTAAETGFLVASEETCKRCHVEQLTLNGVTYKNPSYKDFDFKKAFDEIKHPVPEGKGGGKDDADDDDDDEDDDKKKK